MSASASAVDGGLGLRPASMRRERYYGILRAVAIAEPKVLWTPSPERVERATLTRYARWLGDTRGLEFEGYHDLWRWSVVDLEGFWGSLVEFLGVRFASGGDRVLGSDVMPGASWFPGARVSYAEHVFAGKDSAALAIQHASECRELERLTWGELRSQTAAIAAGLRASGVVAGDRVAAYMPNIPETVAALLACASLGAVWSSAAPEFGARSVIDRFSQIEPKVLLAIDGYRYGGKDFDRSGTCPGPAGRTGSSGRASRWSSSRCRSTTRCGCCIRPAPPGCPSRSSTGRAGSCWSTSRRRICIWMPRPAIVCSGSRQPAG